MVKVDAPFLFIDPKDCIGRQCSNNEHVFILSAPTWHGDEDACGHRLYRCLANVCGMLCVIQVRLIVEA